MISVFLSGCQSYDEPFFEQSTHYTGVIKSSHSKQSFRFNYELRALDSHTYDMSLSYLTYTYRILEKNGKIRIFKEKKEIQTSKLLESFEQNFHFNQPSDLVAMILNPQNLPDGWVVKYKNDKIIFSHAGLETKITRNQF